MPSKKVSQNGKGEGRGQAPAEIVLGRNCHGGLHNDDDDGDDDDDDGDDDHAMMTKGKSRIWNNTKLILYLC